MTRTPAAVPPFPEWNAYTGGGCPVEPGQIVVVEHHWPGGTYIGPAKRALWDYCTKRWRLLA